MHKTTIVQNKTLSIIRSCLFFVWLYRPSLGKVWLGRPNPTPLQGPNFYLRRKKKHSFYSELHALQRTIFNFDFHLFKKFFFYQKPIQILNYIYYDYYFFKIYYNDNLLRSLC